MINPHVEAVVMKALEKRMELRFPDMDEMMRAISDPIGYVEAHGGIVGFGQRQLMPSTVPFTSTPTPSRLSTPTTPPPMTTPLPGSVTPMGGYTPTPPPGQYHHHAAAAPTTLGGAAGAATGTGEVRRSKLGFVLAALAVVAAAIVAIVIVTKNSGQTAGAGSEEDGSNTESGSEVAVAPDAADVKVASGSNPAPRRTKVRTSRPDRRYGRLGECQGRASRRAGARSRERIRISAGDTAALRGQSHQGRDDLAAAGWLDITLDKFVPSRTSTGRTFVKKRTHRCRSPAGLSSGKVSRVRVQARGEVTTPVSSKPGD
jgi:hypothetical protein